MKIIHVIREEHGTLSNSATQSAEAFSLANFVLMGQPQRQQRNATKVHTQDLRDNDEDANERDSFGSALKPVVLDVIQDIQYELESSYDNVARNAKDHIHSEYVRPQSLLSSQENTLKPFFAARLY